LLSRELPGDASQAANPAVAGALHRGAPKVEGKFGGAAGHSAPLQTDAYTRTMAAVLLRISERILVRERGRSCVALLALAALAFAATSCASEPRDETVIAWGKAGATEQQVNADRVECANLAALNQPHFGDPELVAMRLRMFRDCMTSRGYTGVPIKRP